MRQCSGGILRWKRRNRTCAWMDGGEQESARDPRKCRGHWVTRRPVSYGQSGQGSEAWR